MQGFANDWLIFWMICERYGCGLSGVLRVCALVSVGCRMVVVFVFMCCGIVIAIGGDGVESVGIVGLVCGWFACCVGFVSVILFMIGMFVPICVVLPVMIACVMADSWVDIAMASTSSCIFLLSWVI